MYNKFIWAGIIISAILLVASFLMPPLGVIDNSVIMAAGEISFLVTLSVISKAIDKGYDAKMSHGDKVIEIKN